MLIKVFKGCIISACGIIVAIFTYKPICFLICDLLYDPEDPFSCRVEKPLKTVDVNDDAVYLLVKYWNGKIEIVADTQNIKRNKQRFRIANSRSLYGTTADGYFELYKNGYMVEFSIFDKFNYTWAIDYGSLKFNEISQHELKQLISARGEA